jgi:FMN phosphatase YigB (HAD superfamily)
MALTLEQYVSYLDTRDLPWPAAPDLDPPKAKPHLVRLKDVRAVTWNVYGTLLAITGGELFFEHPNLFVMDVALDKTIQEFKWWDHMTRTPLPPAEYLRSVYANLIHELRSVPETPQNFREVRSDWLWEKIIKRLLKKDYRFDAGFFGALNEFSQKVAYFFHASLQGVACFPGALAALRHVANSGLAQGLLGDGQCFTLAQLQRSVSEKDAMANLGQVVDPRFCTLSWEVKARQPSRRLFQQCLEAFGRQGIRPEQVLHIGSRVPLDIVPARKWGMKVGLFAGDKAALDATPAHFTDPASRPDVLLTELTQIAEIVPGL